MRRWWVWLALAASSLGCDDPPCPSKHWCDGDLLMTCDYQCASGGKIDLPRGCTRYIHQVDCAQHGRDSFGVAQTCHSFEAGSSTFVECIDQPVTSCSLANPNAIPPPDALVQVPLACDANANLQRCVGVGTGDGLLMTSRWRSRCQEFRVNIWLPGSSGGRATERIEEVSTIPRRRAADVLATRLSKY